MKTDKELISLWLRSNKSLTTQGGYLKALERFTEHIKHQPLAEVKAADVRDFADMLATTDMAISTQAGTISAIRSLFFYARDIGYFRYNPAERIYPPKRLSKTCERILSQEEVLMIFEACKHHPRNYTLLRLLYYTAIRVSECCQLKWKFMRTREKGGGMVTINGKGMYAKKKQRTIVIPQFLWDDLVKLRGNQNGEAYIFQSETHKSSKGVGIIINYLTDSIL